MRRPVPFAAVRFPALGTDVLVCSPAANDLSRSVRDTVEEGEERFSRFRPSSELERLSGRAGVETVVSPAMVGTPPDGASAAIATRLTTTKSRGTTARVRKMTTTATGASMRTSTRYAGSNVGLACVSVLALAGLTVAIAAERAASLRVAAPLSVVAPAPTADDTAAGQPAGSVPVPQSGPVTQTRGS